jgi:uncharacterized metal-binding protein YceD (DUF177 family)
MKIEFRKITPNPTPFLLEREGYRCEGSFRKLSQKVVEITFHLSAESRLQCDRCASEYEHVIDEDMTLQIADGRFEGEDLDVIEFFDHVVDFDAIAVSEIETVRSDYHLCPACKENQGE